MHKSRIHMLSIEAYHFVFNLLDGDPEMDAESAGHVATRVQQMFKTAFQEVEDNVVYRVHVGNIGTVYEGINPQIAQEIYQEYAEQSKSEKGRAGGEQVTLFKGEEIEEEHDGAIHFEL